jgi:hypothetical protein
MDPLSSAASILAVLSAAGATAQGLEKLWALKDAPNALLAIMNEVSLPSSPESSLIFLKVSSLRTTLRVVELALRSLQTTDYTILQAVLHDINGLHAQASMVLSELDTFITEKLQSRNQDAATPYPKVAKWSWLRQSKNLEKIQSQIRNTSNSLSATLTALHTIQLGSLQKYVTAYFALILAD